MTFFTTRKPAIEFHEFITKKEIDNSVNRHMNDWGYHAVESLLIEEGKIAQTPPSNPLKFMYCKFLIYRKERAVRKEIRMNIYRSISRGLAHQRSF